MKYLTHELIKTKMYGDNFNNDFICTICGVLLYKENINNRFFEIKSKNHLNEYKIFQLTCDEVIIQKIIE